MASDKVYYSDPITPILEIVEHARMNPSEDIRPFIVSKVEVVIEQVQHINSPQFRAKALVLDKLQEVKKAFSTWVENGQGQCYVTDQETKDLLQRVKPKLEVLQAGLGDRMKGVKLTGDSAHDLAAIINAADGGISGNRTLMREVFNDRGFIGFLGNYATGAGYVGLYSKQFPTLTMSSNLEKAVAEAKQSLQTSNPADAQHPGQISNTTASNPAENRGKKLAEVADHR